MSFDRRPEGAAPPPAGRLSSALSSLQGRFAAAASSPVGGTPAPRGESFASSVASVLGGSYVLPGGLGGRGSSVGGATIIDSARGSSPSADGSTAFEVMAGYRDQVISPYSMMEEGEVLFSTPTGVGVGREGVTEPASMLGSTLQELNMKAAAGPPRTRGQTALEQAMGHLGGGARRVDDGSVGGVDDDGGRLKNPPQLGPFNVGEGPQGVSSNVRLFRYEKNGPAFCGGMVGGSKKAPKRFCISPNCGAAHARKVFALLGDGDYYIIEPGPRGGLSQTLRAYLDPPLTKAAAEFSHDNKEVLQGTNSLEGWLSLFRYLTDAATRGDTGAATSELVGFASRARQSAFKTPLRANTKRARDGDSLDEEDGPPPIVQDLQDAILGIQGELGVRYPTASYVTVHGGLKNLEEDVRSVQEGVEAQFRSMTSSNQAALGALQFETSQASARSQEVKRWMEHLQATGGGTAEHPSKTQELRAEAAALRGRCDFLEGAVTQMAAYVSALNDRVDTGGGMGLGPATSLTHVTRGEFDTHAQTVQVALQGFRQEMKGAPVEFGGYSFQGLGSCVAWARTNMPENTYQCIPGMFYGLCLIRESVLYKQDMREDDIQAHRVQRSPMQSTVVESVNTAIPSILEGPKTNALKDPRYDFGAMKSYAEWKPTNGQPGVSTRLKEGLESSWQQIRGAIDMFLSTSPVARGVMNEMLAEYKILTSQLLVTEITLYYEEILSKTGGDPPHSKEVKESCWALVTKLLRTVLKEVHKVRRFAAEAVSIGSDSLRTNGMFLYAAMEELRVLREFSECDWRNHPKFNQSIVRHLFETCLPRAVYETKKEGSHILKLNALMATDERQQALINGLSTGIGELRAKVGLPPAKKKTKFAQGSGGGDHVDEIE